MPISYFYKGMVILLVLFVEVTSRRMLAEPVSSGASTAWRLLTRIDK
jgi:hypothetical protein